MESRKGESEQATLAPLIGSSIQSATGVEYNITGGKDITLQEVNRVSQVLEKYMRYWFLLFYILIKEGTRWIHFVFKLINIVEFIPSAYSHIDPCLKSPRNQQAGFIIAASSAGIFLFFVFRVQCTNSCICNNLFQVVTSLADPSANIIFGAVVDDRYNGEIHVTIIATGFSQSFQKILLTDPKAAKLIDKVAAGQEGKGMPFPLKSTTSPSTVPARPSTRKLFF
jgi:cell division GTPase FtsZ